MSEVNRQAIEQALGTVQDPYLARDLVSLGSIDRVDISGNKVKVAVNLGYPSASIQASVSQSIWQALSQVPGVEDASVEVGWSVPSSVPANGVQTLSEVKNIIAVASGKGGVGKSTTAVNLALALSKEGASVGILDADIYGPSQPQMLGVSERRPETIDQKWIVPIEAYGLQSISMGNMITEQTPMVWRGPMVSGALQQLLGQTRWQHLDYLIVDMPPGTGDIQLTLSQKVPVTGALIVTTPQDIALLDARKGIEMFRKVNVPVLGVVENMAIHICSGCGHQEHIFGEGGGTRIARDYQTELLGALPLSLNIREDTDGGTPSVAKDPESEVSLIYREMARKLGAQLWLNHQVGQAAPVISVVDD